MSMHSIDRILGQFIDGLYQCRTVDLGENGLQAVPFLKTLDDRVGDLRRLSIDIKNVASLEESKDLVRICKEVQNQTYLQDGELQFLFEPPATPNAIDGSNKERNFFLNVLLYMIYCVDIKEIFMIM